MSIDPEKNLPFDGFIEDLKSNGFIIGVDHYLRLQAVLKTFGPDSRPEDLKYILCPIFAKDKKEQEQFYRLFDSFFRIFVPGKEQKYEKTIEKKEKSETPISPDMPMPRKRPYVLLGILLLLLAVFLAQWQVDYNVQQEEKQPTQKYITTSSKKIGTTSTVPFTLEEITTTLHTPLSQPPRPFYQRYGKWIRWILTITPWIVFILIILYQHRRKRLVLLRQRGKRPPYVWPIRVEPQEPRFVKNPHFFSASRHLRQRLQSDVYRLDVEKTIDETIEQSGYPVFCYKAVTRPPEYLMLIDISGQKDHFARYAQSITRVLEEEGIFVSHYFYQNDPMVCFKESEGKREYEDLSVLQTRFKNCRLIIFSTGEGLLDFVTGDLGPWEGQLLSVWKERAIMTPKQPGEWSIHEKVLSQEFILVPATCQGLDALAQSFNNGDHHDLKEWIRRDTLPPVPDTDAIHETEELRSFCRSDDTFQWLCACAVYPELDWDLTLHLRSCVSNTPAREDQMLTLMRLPWFREGAIPDNDRFLLISELDKERLQAVQESIFHVLEGNPPPKDSFAYDGYRLNLFANRRVLKRMTRKQLRELRRAIKGSDEERIIQDYTLMSLLESSKISHLGLILPKALHKIFFRHGLPFLGLKSVVLLLFALVLSLSTFLFIKSPEAPVAVPPQKVHFEFVSIPPGTFMMGSPDEEKGRDTDETQHRVTLTSGFYMQKTEVTQGQWKAVMGNNPSSFRDCGDDCPVERVSWNDVQEFIERLNQIDKEGKFRLPTEAEWEYACRAGSTTAFANGDITFADYSCGYDANLDKMGWYCENSGNKPHKVGDKEPNAWGLYDMHGNVWEWCQDWYGEYEVKGLRVRKIEMQDSNIYGVKDPTGPARGSRRVIRGGGWYNFARYCRSAIRNDGYPDIRYNILGFRLVRSLH